LLRQGVDHVIAHRDGCAGNRAHVCFSAESLASKGKGVSRERHAIRLAAARAPSLSRAS
jgi:hypothetical protein